MFHVKHFRTKSSIIVKMNKFKDRLREIRLEKGITRKQLADVMFVSERLISYWENGKRECNFDTLIKLSEVFNVSTDYLLGKSEFWEFRK